MRASARSLHLYAPVAVCRRPSSETMDPGAPPPRARALRRVAAAVIRCALPSAARWHRLPSAGGRVSLSSLPEAWRAVAADALRASRRGDVQTAGDAAAALSEMVERARLRLAAAMLAEAAALCAPKDAARALRVATLGRDRADHAAAEWWGRRAARLAARAGQWIVAVSAWARVGESRKAREDWHAVLLAARREVRAAKRARDSDRYARALHTLAGAHWLVGERETAWKLANRVCRLYSDTHPRLPILAHDIAVFRMEEGEPAMAIHVLRNVLSVVDQPREQVFTAVHLAMAGAMADNPLAYRVGVEAALQFLGTSGHGELAAWAFAELGRMEAEYTRNLDRARWWASQALALAVARGERGPERTARSVLAGIS